ncbi:hypothetical protein BUALT_Bualt06G0062400 [Buddleja alternifolia]|uniref:ATP synthase YMF19 uncharacterized C-terminal domain-containing protein n=1 Tax=Buddleja alternifolia TaxID=168488 RepID=A0AAV6XEN1_9LAMI|nr:hypothetical protein BUALT_Bualt06G0062400 [Buddleja alternifolia]
MPSFIPMIYTSVCSSPLVRRSLTQRESVATGVLFCPSSPSGSLPRYDFFLPVDSPLIKVRLKLSQQHFFFVDCKGNGISSSTTNTSPLASNWSRHPKLQLELLVLPVLVFSVRVGSVLAVTAVGGITGAIDSAVDGMNTKAKASSFNPNNGTRRWSTWDKQNSKTTEPTGFTPGDQHPEQRPQEFGRYLEKRFSTGVSYMYGSLFEVSQWCNAVDLLGKRKKITLISCFGELSGSRGMERNIFYLISKSSYSTSSNPGWGITCRNDIMLMHVLHGQGSIDF